MVSAAAPKLGSARQFASLAQWRSFDAAIDSRTIRFDAAYFAPATPQAASPLRFLRSEDWRHNGATDILIQINAPGVTNLVCYPGSFDPVSLF